MSATFAVKFMAAVILDPAPCNMGCHKSLLFWISYELPVGKLEISIETEEGACSETNGFTGDPRLLLNSRISEKFSPGATADGEVVNDKNEVGPC